MPDEALMPMSLKPLSEHTRQKLADDYSRAIDTGDLRALYEILHLASHDHQLYARLQSIEHNALPPLPETLVEWQVNCEELEAMAIRRQWPLRFLHVVFDKTHKELGLVLNWLLSLWPAIATILVLTITLNLLRSSQASSSYGQLVLLDLLLFGSIVVVGIGEAMKGRTPKAKNSKRTFSSGKHFPSSSSLLLLGNLAPTAILVFLVLIGSFFVLIPLTRAPGYAKELDMKAGELRHISFKAQSNWEALCLWMPQADYQDYSVAVRLLDQSGTTKLDTSYNSNALVPVDLKDGEQYQLLLRLLDKNNSPQPSTPDRLRRVRLLVSMLEDKKATPQSDRAASN